VVSLLGLLLLGLVLGGIHLPSDNSLALTRGSGIKMLNNQKHSHDRMLLSFSHEAHGNIGKNDGRINADLRLTAGNADGSGQDQKALPHWTFNPNSNQSGKHYEEKRELQKQNGQGKSHLSVHQIIKTVVASIAVALALVVVCYIFVLLWCKCGQRVPINVPQVQHELCGVSGPRRFQFHELAAATDNFTDDKKLGQGGFGPVYRGFLRDEDRHVAIKLLSAETSWQGKKEFDAEVKVLTLLRHRNIVQLVGCCESNEGFLLVYELMAEGSLDKHLHNPVRVLSWQQRYKIILDLGSALLYLHRCCDKCIVHGDIKPENVMLDASFNAKLGDFGTARLMEHGAEPRTTEIVAGTRGYIDPEFVNNHLRCPDADIYSFGVTLLEIASGKRPASRQPSEASALPLWVRSLYDRHKLLDAADGKMNGEFDRQQMEHVLVTGLWCAHQDPSQRPSIEQAMDVLRCVDATLLPVLPMTRDAQQVHLLEELAYGDQTGEGASVEVAAASTCYLTSKDSAYLLAEE